MEKNNQQTWIWIVVVLIIVIAILFFVFGNKQTVAPVINNQALTNNQVTTEPESVQDITSQDIGAAAIPLSYTKALAQYADRRIQLDLICQAHPTNVTYKDNTGIMIDNRSPQTRTITVGKTFTIKPWGFKIVVLPDVYLKTKTLLVDCDKSQNVATILIQE